MGGVQQFTVRSGQPEQTVDFGAGGGTVTVTGGTVFYRDEPGVTSSVNDGSIADGGSATLLGTQFFSTSASRVDGQVRLADVAASGSTGRAWAPATVYTAGDMVSQGGTVIARTTGGTSRASYDTTEQALWTTVGSYDPTITTNAATAGTYRAAWAGSIAYIVGDLVTFSGALWRCVTAHTSNSAGWFYNRQDWAPAAPVPVADMLVPVTGIDLTNVGAGSSNPPTAHLFQVQPKRLTYHKQRVLWAFSAPTDVTTSGTFGAALAAGTEVGGSIVATSHATAVGLITTSVLGTAVDFTGQHLRIPVKMSAKTGNFVNIRLSSTGTTFTNCLQASLVSGNVDGNVRTGGWSIVSIAPTEMTTIGTGVTLTAINCIQIETDAGSASFTLELSYIAIHSNAADKAKCILWLDDGSWSSHLTALTIAARYGFPMTLSFIANNITASGSNWTADKLRYVQDVLGGQLTVHAFGATEHNTVETGDIIARQIARYQHLGQAMGFDGMEDLGYWSTGFQGNDIDDRADKVRKLVRSARGLTARVVETLPPGDPMMTRALSSPTAATATPFIDRAIACKGLAQFVWHDMAGTPLTDFQTIVDYLNTNRSSIEVVTPQGAYDPLSGT